MKEISYNGKSYKSLTDLAIEMKTSPANLSYRLKKYGGFEIKKEKKIKDHLGNAFETEKKMCELDGLQHSLLAQKVCNRRFGIGAYGMIVVAPSKVATMQMIFYNADGIETNRCHNVEELESVFN